MANTYLDKIGLQLVWNKIKALFVAKEEGSRLITSEEITKLENIANNANNYVLPEAGENLGGVKNGGVANVENGVITAITSTQSAEKVANKLYVKNGTTVVGEYDGSAAVNVDVVGTGSANVSGEAGKLTINVPEIPTTLPNPAALTIKLNSGNIVYDGRAAQEVALVASDLGIANVLTFKGAVESLPASAASGDVYIVGSKEYAYYDGEWIELGDGDSHALKTIAVTAGTGLTGGGTLANNFSISHGNTSDVANVAAADRTYVKSLTFDDFGHVTAVTTGAETVVDTGATEVEVIGSGNAITGASYSAENRKITFNKEATFNNYTYVHENDHPAGSAPNKALGFYKISTDGKSHVSSAEVVTKADITNLIGEYIAITEAEIDEICVL